MVQKSRGHQLILVNIYHDLRRVLYTPGGTGFLPSTVCSVCVCVCVWFCSMFLKQLLFGNQEVIKNLQVIRKNLGALGGIFFCGSSHERWRDFWCETTPQNTAGTKGRLKETDRGCFCFFFLWGFLCDFSTKKSFRKFGFGCCGVFFLLFKKGWMGKATKFRRDNF